MNLLKDKRQTDWFWIENDLIDRTDLTIYEKMVYVVLVRHSNDSSRCFPSYKTIALKANCSERQAKKVIGSLIEKELISKQIRVKKNKNENDSNLYYIGSSKRSECDAQHVVHQVHNPSECDAQPVVHEVHTNNTNYNNTIYSRVITRLNDLTSKDYKSNTSKTKSLIDARLKEGFTEEDFYSVIENKVTTWKGTDMEKYLRPATLFGNKFESYLNEVSKKKTSKKEEIKEESEFYPKIEFENY